MSDIDEAVHIKFARDTLALEPEDRRQLDIRVIGLCRALLALATRAAKMEAVVEAAKRNRQVMNDQAVFARNGATSMRLLVDYEKTRNEMWAALDTLAAGDGT